MHDDGAALPISLYSIVLRKAAVSRSFPGGMERLRVKYPIRQENATLAILASMSPGEVEQHLRKLEQAGLVPGVDLAIGDMMLGPLLPCPGIVFSNAGDDLLPSWHVEYPFS